MFKFVVLTALVASAVAFRLPPHNRIVGGEEADIEDYPHQVSFQVYGDHQCGGSIISEKWIVTAAHCTDGSPPEELNILAGVSNLNEDGQKIQVLRYFQHPKYDSLTLDYDISVVELAEPIQFGENAQPIALPDEDSDPAEGTDVVCTGWGDLEENGEAPEDLQAVTVQIVDREACDDEYFIITDRMVCASVPEGGKDACQGDSGGPLVADGKLVGVVSWSLGCGRPGFPGVYANVGNLRSFIREHSGL